MPNIRRASLALFLLAMSVLLLEIALTRVLSVMSYYHFAYLIISLALLGFGAASNFLTVSPRFGADGVDSRQLARFSLLFCVTTVLSFATLTKIRFHPMDAYLYGDYSNVFSLLLLCVIIGVPFFFAGICIGHLISRAGEAVSRLYFADLLGAGVGALLSVVSINHLGAESTVYIAATAGGIVALLYLKAGERAWIEKASVATAVVLCVMMAVLGGGRPSAPSFRCTSRRTRSPPAWR